MDPGSHREPESLSDLNQEAMKKNATSWEMQAENTEMPERNTLRASDTPNRNPVLPDPHRNISFVPIWGRGLRACVGFRKSYRRNRNCRVGQSPSRLHLEWG